METKQYIKIYRLKKRIYNMLKNNNNCLFLTFTFNDETLNNTTKETRKRYIKAYLNDFAKEYILNIDYGKKTQREHYHAIATPKYKIFLYDKYYKRYGSIDGQKIGQLKRFANVNKSIDEIAERLTIHATKDTTRNNKIIYSRPNKTFLESKYKNEIDNKLLFDEHERQWEEYKKQLEKEEEEQPNFFKLISA